MTRTLHAALFVLPLSIFWGTSVHAATWTAASCNTANVQSAINSAAEGDTVLIPAGTCTWTSGVTISGKGITVQGAGSGRIIAYDNGTETPTIGTGTKTFNIAGYSPGFSASSITTGETLRVFENNARANYMQGTVTSLSSGVLTMNITITGGSGSTHRWLVSTVPTTTITNNSSTTLFSVNEDTAVHTNISGFKVAEGTGTGDDIDINYTSGGQAVLVHDCWFEQNNSPSDSVHSSSNRGVVWNCSFDSTPFSMAPLAVHMENAPTVSWTTTSSMGSADATGQNNFYVESSDFYAYLNAVDNDNNGRLVFRYNLMNNAGFGTHGADTSSYGQRYFEYYNNTGVFNGYSDGTTFSLDWWVWVRGGTYVVYNNTLPVINSQDYPNKSSIIMIVMNLQRNAGPNPCWGAGTSGGADYHTPRQVGFGNVTGTGHDGLGRTNDSVTYVGDSEPAYIWGNSSQPLTNVNITNYGTGFSDSCTGTTDTSQNYIVSGRDYFNGSTAKPGWAPYTYPHPLTQADPPAPPTGLQATTY